MSIAEQLLDRLNSIQNLDEKDIALIRKQIIPYQESVNSGDTGLREIETVGFPSRADEKDIEKGLFEILSMAKA
jgi:hypothetical protein